MNAPHSGAFLSIYLLPYLVRIVLQNKDENKSIVP